MIACPPITTNRTPSAERSRRNSPKSSLDWVAIFLTRTQALVEQLEGEFETFLGCQARFSLLLRDVPLLDGHPSDATIHDVVEVYHGTSQQMTEARRHRASESTRTRDPPCPTSATKKSSIIALFSERIAPAQPLELARVSVKTGPRVFSFWGQIGATPVGATCNQ
jgi:hypothetical protein